MMLTGGRTLVFIYFPVPRRPRDIGLHIHSRCWLHRRSDTDLFHVGEKKCGEASARRKKRFRSSAWEITNCCLRVALSVCSQQKLLTHGAPQIPKKDMKKVPFSQATNHCWAIITLATRDTRMVLAQMVKTQDSRPQSRSFGRCLCHVQRPCPWQRVDQTDDRRFIARVWLRSSLLQALPVSRVNNLSLLVRVKNHHLPSWETCDALK